MLVVPDGFCWQGKTYDSLSSIAKTITGTSWNGPRFFGLRSPDITSSIEPARQDKQHQSSASESERQTTALAPDQIGAFLHGNPVDGGSHLVRAAQIALEKLGYAVKPDGAEDGAPGVLFSILSARTGWPRPLKSARNSSNNLRRRREVDAAAGRAGLLMNRSRSSFWSSRRPA